LGEKQNGDGNPYQVNGKGAKKKPEDAKKKPTPLAGAGKGGVRGEV